MGAWWSERRCAAEWGDFVRPDAYGVWEEGGDRVEFFVEHDTGTETLARVAAKLDGYRDLAEAEGAARPPGGPPRSNIDTLPDGPCRQIPPRSANQAGANTL